MEQKPQFPFNFAPPRRSLTTSGLIYLQMSLAKYFNDSEGYMTRNLQAFIPDKQKFGYRYAFPKVLGNATKDLD